MVSKLDPALPLNVIASLDIHRWLWSPGFHGPARYVAIAAAVVILFLALGSIAWRRGSGPATHVERKTAKRRVRIVYTICAIAFPIFLAAGVWLFLFPAPKPSELALVSRVNNPATFDNLKWTNALAKGTQENRLLDAGLLVDEVLRRLSSRIPQLHLMATPGYRWDFDLVREIVRDTSLEQDLGALSVTRADLTPRPRSTNFPPWLVESIEMACCRLLLERTNVRKVTVASANRADRYGEPTSSDYRGYLSGSGFIDQKQILIIDSSVAGDSVTILRALRWTGDQAVALLKVPALVGPSGVEQLTIERISPSGVALRSIEPVTRRPHFSIVSKLVSITPTTEAIQVTSPTGVSSKATVPPAVPPIEVWVQPTLLPDMASLGPDPTWMLKMYEELAAEGNVEFQYGSPPNGSIGVYPSSGGVWIHHKDAEFDSTLRFSSGSMANVREGSFAKSLPPSILSLDKIQWHIPAPAIPTAAGFQLAWAPGYRTSPFRPPLTLGALKSNEDPRPLSLALPDAVDPNRSVVWLGSMPPAASNSVETAAYWWTVSQLARRCNLPASSFAPTTDSVHTSAEARPIRLLRDSDIALVAASAYSSGSRMLMIALCLAAIASLYHLSIARKRIQAYN